MRHLLLAGAVAIGLSAASGFAHSAVIDFNALPNGPAANPLTVNGVTFTSAGFSVIVDNGYCAAVNAGSASDCSEDLQVDFSGPVTPISFAFLYNNDQTIGHDIGGVSLFDGATLLGIVNVLVTDTDPFTKDLVSLSGFNHVTRLVITSTDFFGVGYDDFTYQSSSSTALPEPASWALMIGGFGVAGAMMRRRRAAVA